MAEEEKQGSEEAILPDEILGGEGFEEADASEGFRNVRYLKEYCNKRPWLRILCLLLSFVVISLSFLLLVGVLVTGVAAALSFFKSEEANALVNKTFAFYRHFLAAALALFVGFFSPAFGAGIAFIYFILAIDNTATVDSLIAQYAPKE